MLLHISEVRIGFMITKDIFNSFGIIVVSAGETVTSEVLELLNKHKIDYLHALERTEEPDQEEIRNRLLAFESSIDSIKSLFGKAEKGQDITETEVDEGFVPFIGSFKQERDMVSLLLLLNNKDDYTYHHCVHVGMISYFIAKWLDKSEDEALYIGKAGYLHDIGKSKIEPSILNKPDRLTNAEFEEMKRHTVYGYDIIQKTLKNEDFALTALQHHERVNGNGYPLKKTEPHIHPMAKIVAVADIYSAMITTRVYQKKRDLLTVLKEIHRISFTELEANIAHTFIKNMIPNFIGKSVLFADGQTGKIIMTNPTDFFRPLVQIQDRFIDMSVHHSLEILDIYL